MKTTLLALVLILGGCAPLITAAQVDPGCETVTYLVERTEADGQIYADVHERCE